MLVADDGVTEYIYMNGISGQDYYIVVNHRNHLSIMSKTAETMSDNSSDVYDFTVAGQSYGNGGMKEIETGVWGMWGGDINQDKVINTTDYIQWYNSAILSEIGYKYTDTDLNAIVNTTDYVNWYNNARLSIISQVP